MIHQSTGHDDRPSQMRSSLVHRGSDTVRTGPMAPDLLPVPAVGV